MTRRIEDKRKNYSPVNTLHLAVLFIIIFLVAVLVYLEMVLFLDERHRLPSDADIVATAEFLLENPPDYGNLVLTGISTTQHSLGNQTLCFSGITNPSGVITIDGTIEATINIIVPTPDASEATSDRPFCWSTTLSLGLHLISYQLYETQGLYQWAIEIE